MTVSPRFALNHIVAPRLDYRSFFDLAVKVGLTAVELRNEMDGNAIKDGTPPKAIRQAARERNLTILTINALRRFNDRNGASHSDAQTLVSYARDCGAEAVVICPVNDPAFRSSHPDRIKKIQEALFELKPVFLDAGVRGLIEVVGFASSSLSLKREAVEAIDAVDGNEVFQLVHDSFHHYLAADMDIYPDRTGLVHISGVATDIAPKNDTPRILVDERDIMRTTEQMAILLDGGYENFFSFEPFAPSVQNAADIAVLLSASARFIEKRLRATRSKL